MPIIKRGFRMGFRGRQKPSEWGRRAHYLASEHGREGVVLEGESERELTIEQAIEALGGPKAEYHEIIIAPSLAECEAIRKRKPEDPRREAMKAGHRIARSYAMGRPYLLSMHEQDGRFHFHLNFRGSENPEGLGRRGHIQRAWDEEFRGVAPRIQDWEAHQRFLNLKSQLQQVRVEQRENEQRRRNSIRAAPANRKIEIARPFERNARELVEE